MTQGAALLSQLTDCTPYLLQLGLTKSRTSLVWIAGPLSGLIMQPVVGVLADNSRSKWGRRRPFMIGGSLIVAICLLVLGWTGEIVRLFVREPETVGGLNRSRLWFPAYASSQAKTFTIALAVLSIYAVDFAINAGWCCICREQTDRTTNRVFSPVIMSKSNSGHFANCKTAAWFCLGYVLVSPLESELIFRS